MSDTTLLQERLVLSIERLKEIEEEHVVEEHFLPFFSKEASFLLSLWNLRQKLDSIDIQTIAYSELKEQNASLYSDILPEHYQQSFGNPRYASSMLGTDYSAIFSFLYTEIHGCISFIFENRIWDFLVTVELFLEFYSMFTEEVPSANSLKKTIYSHFYDYCFDMMEYRVREMIDPSLDFATKIIMESDLSKPDYLYHYGEYVSDTEERISSYLASLDETAIESMARTYTEGYRIGFVLGNKDLSKKKTVNIRYSLGFERMVKAAILQFRKMGLSPVIYRSASHAINKQSHIRIGYLGSNPNKQYDFDHQNDQGIFLDDKMVSQKLNGLQKGFESYAVLAKEHAGPACIETFGEVNFTPAICESSITLTEEQQKLKVYYAQNAGQITNRYIIGEERSFTIIAYPVPEIGDQFEEIFNETVRINTLDYNKYSSIQQRIIEALDQAQTVHIKGMNGNDTDLTIMLHTLSDIKTQTNFENCVADVNIPVGEVFTSPCLAGTNGLLHVKQVYLEGLKYQDLKIEVKDGMTGAYSCRNFDSEEESKRFIEENIMFYHKSLPMGEFAIGTNTTAYKMAKDYSIEDKLPILIAEKMGPHFAFGDTCYSHAEDIAVFNPDGREIIARDNERSLLRNTDPGNAYFQCHTDITIPYDELKSVIGKTKDGVEIPIILEGKFVLPGTEELNIPLEHL